MKTREQVIDILAKKAYDAYMGGCPGGTLCMIDTNAIELAVEILEISWIDLYNEVYAAAIKKING